MRFLSDPIFSIRDISSALLNLAYLPLTHLVATTNHSAVQNAGPVRSFQIEKRKTKLKAIGIGRSSKDLFLFVPLLNR